MNGQARLVATQNGLYAAAGYPDDGRTYAPVTPVSDTAGEHVVWWRRGIHVVGRALTHPEIGERLRGAKGWPIEDRADYWIEFVSDDDLAAYLRGDRARADGRPLVTYVRISRVWFMPRDGVPAQRSTGS